MEYKRSPLSLVAQYELEPSLVDIYVEGQRDKVVLDWFLSRQSVSSVNVCPIDWIDIPDSVLDTYGLTKRSNRSKVLALATELSAHFHNSIRVLCIIDRDFEDCMPRIPACPLLSLTDGNSIESYAFNEVCLRKFTSIVLGGFVLPPNELLACLGGILRELYAIRLANEKLGWCMEYLPFRGYLCLAGKQVKFDKESFIKAYLLKNRRWNERNQFAKTLGECMAQLPLEATRSARGHDLGELLLYVIHSKR